VTDVNAALSGNLEVAFNDVPQIGIVVILGGWYFAERM
jgi:hypothetical protein